MFNILSFLKIGAFASLISIILILTLVVKKADHQRDKALAQVQVLEADIIKQNAAVDQMKKEATKQISRLLIAQKEAQKERAVYTEKAKKLMAQNVPSDCTEAIKWGAKEGSILYKFWMLDCQSVNKG